MLEVVTREDRKRLWRWGELFVASRVEDTRITDEDKQLLLSIGLPKAPFGYKTAVLQDGLPLLEDMFPAYCEAKIVLNRYRLLAVADLYIGHLCLDMDTGAVVQVVGGGSTVALHIDPVNSNLVAFWDCLYQVYDLTEGLDQSFAESTDEEMFLLIAKLRTAITSIDPSAMEDEFSFWSTILSEMLHR